jgi:hypothetical protein
MKRKFTKILGVGLTLALLTSLLLTAAPVSADVSSAAVTIPTAGDNVISKLNPNYVLRFSINKSISVGAGDTITVTLPADTVVGATAGGTATASPGWVGLTWTNGDLSGVTWSTVPASRQIVLTLGGTDVVGEGAEIRISITSGITNPTSAGTYNLTVKTTQETTAITSASYTIAVPTIPALPGVVSLYNPSGVLMTQGTGATAIDDAIDGTAPFTSIGANFTIQVGPGTYANAITQTVARTGLTVIATGTAEETIITGNVTLAQPSTTITGFTINGLVSVSGGAVGTEVVVTDNIIKDNTGAATAVTVTGGVAKITNNTVDITGTNANTAIGITGGTATISGNTITLGAADTGVNASGAGTTATVTGNSITGGGTSGKGILIGAVNTNTITSNTINGARTGIDINAAATVTVKSNTIQNGPTTTPVALTDAAIRVANAAAAPNGVLISGNTISNNLGYSVTVVGGTAADIQIIGNSFSANTAGFSNQLGAGTLDATLNFWGASGPTVAGGTGDKITTLAGGTTTYMPFDTVGISQVTYSTAIATGPGTIDASTTVGITLASNDAVGNGPVTLAKYAGNPSTSATPYPAIAYYDIYAPAAGGTLAAGESIIVRFYSSGITADTVAYYFSELSQRWTACTNSAVAGNLAYVVVTITTTSAPSDSELKDTKFALVSTPMAALTAPTIVAPAAGATDVDLSPTFSWSTVSVAAGYYFELADNANFVAPLAKLSGDLGRLIVTAYHYAPDLEYSTAYYWRVKAVSGTVEAGTLAESAWTTSVLITMDEPEEPAPPIVVEEVQPPDIVIEQTPAPVIQPIVEVVTPPETPITPAWIYAIIGVGAVLVIALIVLVVRTRRVA